MSAQVRNDIGSLNAGPSTADIDDVTATVTSGTATATGVTGLGKNERNFLSQVIAWPAPNEPGYGNLHFMMPSKKDPKTKFMTGWPFRDVATFVQRAAWALSTDNIKDMFFCTSLQSQAGKNSRGKPRLFNLGINFVRARQANIDPDLGFPRAEDDEIERLDQAEVPLRTDALSQGPVKGGPSVRLEAECALCRAGPAHPIPVSSDQTQLGPVPTFHQAPDEA
jgi:hypothetical protein